MNRNALNISLIFTCVYHYVEATKNPGFVVPLKSPVTAIAKDFTPSQLNWCETQELVYATEGVYDVGEFLAMKITRYQCLRGA